MDNNIFNDIKNYINFLRQCGYNVMLSCFGDKFEPYTTELLKYDIHVLSVCNYLKRNSSTIGKCIHNKRKLEKTAFTEPYYSCCYAGVEEYVIPIWYKKEFLLYVSVSGYRNTIDKSKKNMREVASICDKKFKELYKELSTNVPPLNDIMQFIKPLEYMVISFYKFCRDNYGNKENLSVTKELYLKVVRYMHENYMHELSCANIAKEMKYSPSYLRYVFKKEENISVVAKINEIKLSHAMYLLLNTKLTITEISFNCGFCDSNYFSTTFKKKYGISPKLYRNKYVNKEYDAYSEN